MAKILIVDDSPTDLHVVTKILHKNGFETVTAENAEAGIAKAKSEQPDLVLMDVVMPGMNGFQATRSLSKDAATSSIPVIILTTKSMETDKMWGMRQGAKEYLIKPPNEKELITKVKALIGG
jgi:twitching motility two-component system response regulator PilH